MGARPSLMTLTTAIRVKADSRSAFETTDEFVADRVLRRDSVPRATDGNTARPQVSALIVSSDPTTW
jgi:hypothetical protein